MAVLRVVLFTVQCITIVFFCHRANTAFGTFASRDFAKVLNTKVGRLRCAVCSV